MINLLNKIKSETFIFNDEQIIDKINQLDNQDSNCMELFIMRELYNDKKTLTKDEYAYEVIQYLYANSIDSKATVDSVVDESSEWFYDQYEKACKGETTYYHAVQYCRNQLMGFLRHRLVDNSNNDDIEDDFEEDYFSQKYKE